ncbi:MAG: electron transfer flavoprotein subunit alpha/FixB family protein [Calditrichaeota bacterium]|nr:MAG: electron transfer flavoprotein subunit alpha/FixB family protein [Calditrichota bacterium]
MATILVVTEIREGQFKSVNNEVFTAAHKIASELGGSVQALLMGPQANTHASGVGQYGVETALVLEDSKLEKYSADCYAAAVAETAKQISADYIFMAATFMGKDLMARVAQLLNTALAQDCINLRVEDGNVIFHRPMFAGKVLADVTISSKPALATIRPKAFKAEEHPVDASVQSISVELPEPLAVVEEIEASPTGKIDVTEADIIVSGGRGMGGPENWGLIEELADLLGAATGCSRPVSDDGWRPHDEHIGQTGKTVSPNLYIACGISGAIQHLAGMSSSKYIVAINKDPEAPIFKVADYGIVGDVFDVLPKMIEEVKKLKAND